MISIPGSRGPISFSDGTAELRPHVGHSQTHKLRLHTLIRNVHAYTYRGINLHRTVLWHWPGFINLWPHVLTSAFACSDKRKEAAVLHIIRTGFLSAVLRSYATFSICSMHDLYTPNLTLQKKRCNSCLLMKSIYLSGMCEVASLRLDSSCHEEQTNYRAAVFFYKVFTNSAWTERLQAGYERSCHVAPSFSLLSSSSSLLFFLSFSHPLSDGWLFQAELEFFHVSLR